MERNMENTKTGSTENIYKNFSTGCEGSYAYEDGGMDTSSTIGTSTVGGVPVRESWTAMAQNLYSDVQMLWDRQSMLVRTEMNEKLTEIKAASVSIGVGSVLLMAGLFSLVATAMICLSLVIPLWASAVIVTALCLIVGGVMVMGARKKLEADKIRPVHSIEAFGEISSTLKERLYEFKH